MMLSLALVACTTELPIPPGAGAAPVVSEQPTQTDVIVQTPSAKVDVLWAVDRALVGQHLALGTHFPVFLEPFVESKYGWFNMEQMILITEEGFELLSKAPTDFFQIP